QPARAVGAALEARVVEHPELAAMPLHVELDPARAEFQRLVEGGQRVLGRMALGAAVADDEERRARRMAAAPDARHASPTLRIFISLVPPGPVKSPLVSRTRSPFFSSLRSTSVISASLIGAMIETGVKSTG